MITAIRVQNQMNCEFICKKVHEAIIKYQKENTDLNDTLIVIDIKKISNDIDLIPKLEFNPS